MLVNDIEGAALARVMNPDSVGRNPLRRELQGAYREVVQTIRDSDSEMCDDVAYVDLVALKNTYPVPASTDSIRRVERRDMTSLVADDDMVYAPCGRVALSLLSRARTPAYAMTPGSSTAAPTFTIWPTPPNDFERGVRVITMPEAEDLNDDTQTPRLKRQLHEPIVAHLIRRLGSLAGVQLAPDATDYIATQEKYLMAFINPNGREVIQRFARTKTTYHPRRF